MSVIALGSHVVMHYSLHLEGGFVADTSGDEPLDFVLGDGTLEPGLERHLVGLRPGEQREFAIAPGTVFPFPTKAAMQVLERSAFPDDSPLEPGLIFEFNTPAGGGRNLLPATGAASRAMIRSRRSSGAGRPLCLWIHRSRAHNIPSHPGRGDRALAGVAGVCHP